MGCGKDGEVSTTPEEGLTEPPQEAKAYTPSSDPNEAILGKCISRGQTPRYMVIAF